ncbi:MAG: sulfatase-like hydrolase/transferase [Candidatus Brocadiaceae bacterium]|jgi:choline-sulfatase
MSDRKPNILILMPDQQRADCMGCAGHPQIRTPNMDRIAAEGAHFVNACTVSPLCMPARASFISGRYVHEHGMWGNEGELSPDYPSLFRSLQECGYHTAHVGKSHYYAHGEFHMREREPYMHARGFDYVHETTGPWATTRTQSYMTDRWHEKGLLKAFREDYEKRWGNRATAVWPSPLPVDDFMDSYIGREGVRFVEQYEGDRPFCLFVGFGGPHEPWDAPGEYATMYDPSEVPSPMDYEPAEPGPWVPRRAARWQRKHRVEELTEDAVRRLRANYYGKISLIDTWVGRILEACERKGTAEDTLVVFWSDHGEMAGDHRLLFKSRFYEAALRVPLMIRWPGKVPPGTRPGALAETVDIMPTILEAVGADAPEGCAGSSLWPALRDPDARIREAVLSEVRKHGRHNSMVRTRRYKYAEDEKGRGYMLHDLERDPHECNNLIGDPDHADVEEEMRELLRRRSGGST